MYKKKKYILLLLICLLLLAAVVVVLLLTESEEESGTSPEKGSAEMAEALPETAEEAEKSQKDLEENKVYSTEIKDIFKHCIRVEESDGGYYPLRFSEKRINDYANYPPIPYAGCTAGVTMEFITDAPTIRFDYKITKNLWPSGFDIYENGEYQESVDASKKLQNTVEYTRKVTDGASEIVITLPVASHTVIRNPELGSFKTDVTGDKPKLLVLGDSISQGLFSSKTSKNWPFLVADALGLDYLNLSVGGETFRRAALDDDVPFDPDYIIVALGTNDLFYTRYMNVIRQNIDDYLSTLQRIYPGVPVTLITPFAQRGLSSGSNMFNLTRYRELTGVMEELAEVYGCQVIDGSELVPAEVEYFAENDGVHLSALGFETVAKNLVKQLELGGE